MPMTASHVFVIRGNLLALHCDALGISGNTSNAPSKGWRDQGIEAVFAEAPASRVDARRSVRLLVSKDGAPARYVVPVAGNPTRDWGWYLDALRVFVARAADDARGKPPRSGRARPNLAVPLLGAGRGGQGEVAGEQLRELIDALGVLASEHAVDLTLVLNDQPAYDAAQSYRRSKADAMWPGLPAGLRVKADELAAEAVSGNLALFLGAGVSAGAGLPGWGQLIEQIAADVVREDERDAFAQLPTLDRAELLERRLGRAGGNGLGARIARRIGSHGRYALSHALLALLPVREIVTTNYDKLFELAYAGARGHAAALHRIPHEGPPERGRPWVMKLHGCVDTPDDIVLSRRTFLHYDAARAALAAMLASLLVTRHVLVVGSSFTDDNVLRIFDEVQRLWSGYPAIPDDAAPTRPPARLGANLSVGGNAVHRALWERDFDWIDLGKGPEGGRMLELFLDRMVAAAGTSASYLFEPAYASLLTADDHAVVRALEALRDALPANRTAALNATLQDLQARFGLRTAGHE